MRVPTHGTLQECLLVASNTVDSAVNVPLARRATLTVRTREFQFDEYSMPYSRWVRFEPSPAPSSPLRRSSSCRMRPDSGSDRHLPLTHAVTPRL